MLYLKCFGIWFLFVILAILNGTIRNELISPEFGDYAGHVASTIILSAIIFIITFLFIKQQQISSKNTLFLIGLSWLTLTITFEFLFGHYVVKHPWSVLLADYNIFNGRLWILVLITTFFSPLLSSKIISK